MTWLSEELVRALGLTILDSLWQGAAVLLLCTLLLLLMRRQPAQLRFKLVLVCILALPVLATISFTAHYDPPVSTTSPLTVSSSQTQLFSGADTLLPAEVPAPGLLASWQEWALANARWVALAWIAGMLIFSLRLAGGLYMVWSIKTSVKEPDDPRWLEKLNNLCSTLKLRIPVAIKESVKVSSPVVMGYFKPIIIFPLGLLQGLHTDEVEAILLHELAHIKRHDYLLNLLVSLLQVLFFYHPAYWWLQRQLDNEREYSCDDLVLGQTNGLTLIKALTSVKEFQLHHYSPALGFASQKNQLLKRVERIMKKKTRTNWMGSLVSTSALLLSFFLMSYQSQQPATDSENTELNAEQPVESILEETAELTPQLPEQNRVQTSDSLDVDKAVIQLLNQRENDLNLELDGQGRLIGVKRKGQEVSMDELKVFQEAHAKLRQYSYSEIEMNQRNKLLRQQLLATQRVMDKLESESSSGTLTRLTEELVGKISTSESNERLLRERLESAERAREEYEVILKELKETSPESTLRIEELKIKQGQHAVKIEEYKQLLERLAGQVSTSPGKYEFTKTDLGQQEAARYLAWQHRANKKALIVVDDEVKTSWKIADLDNMDKSWLIESVDVIRLAYVKSESHKKLMKENDRDLLVLVKTAPGEKGYMRPIISVAQPLITDVSELELQERFAKLLIDTMTEDELAPKGWSSLELSTESFLIDGKKQPKKVLKKYLKLYEDFTGKALIKGKVIELQE